VGRETAASQRNGERQERRDTEETEMGIPPPDRQSFMRCGLPSAVTTALPGGEHLNLLSQLLL
jgi:hypothetical protein